VEIEIDTFVVLRYENYQRRDNTLQYYCTTEIYSGSGHHRGQTLDIRVN